jgi:hypothetical protein
MVPVCDAHEGSLTRSSTFSTHQFWGGDRYYEVGNFDNHHTALSSLLNTHVDSRSILFRRFYGHQQNIVLDLRRSLVILVLYRHEIHDKGFFHSKHRIVVEVLAPSIEDLRGDRFVALSKRLQNGISISRNVCSSSEKTALTMKWICAGLKGCLSISCNNLPLGPSDGTGYGVGLMQ